MCTRFATTLNACLILIALCGESVGAEPSEQAKVFREVLKDADRVEVEPPQWGPFKNNETKEFKGAEQVKRLVSALDFDETKHFLAGC